MIRRFFLLTVLLAGFVVPAFAQDADSTPPPDPMQYNDPAMHFQAPAGFRLLGQRKVALADLGDDPEVVAGWINPQNGLRIAISQQSFNGDAKGFADQYQTQVHTNLDDAIVKSHTPMSLKNGMPAYFVEVTTGSGFSTAKLFSVVWADGARGVSISASGALGSIDAASAKRLLSDASAVAYPTDRT